MRVWLGALPWKFRGRPDWTIVILRIGFPAFFFRLRPPVSPGGGIAVGVWARYQTAHLCFWAFGACGTALFSVFFFFHSCCRLAVSTSTSTTATLHHHNDNPDIQAADWTGLLLLASCLLHQLQLSTAGLPLYLESSDLDTPTTLFSTNNRTAFLVSTSPSTAPAHSPCPNIP